MMGPSGAATRARQHRCFVSPIILVAAALAFLLGLVLGGVLGAMFGIPEGIGGDHTLLQSRGPRRGRALAAASPTTLEPTLTPTPAASATPTAAASTPSAAALPSPLPRARPRNLVICLAEGVEYNGAAGVRWLARFGGSFRRFNERDDVVFLTEGVNASVAPLLESVRLTPLLFGNETAPWSEMEVATRRWHLIRVFLEAHAAEYAGGWVLAIDARDTFFQKDPFSFPRAPEDEEQGSSKGSLYVFLEGRGELIRDSDWNMGVLSACYTDDQLAPVINNPVSCSGTVMGTYSAMVAYLKLMEREILATAASPVCMAAGGRDQGFHNVIIHRGDLAREMNVVQFDNPTGALVRTVRANEYFIDRLGRVLTDRGEIASVVHQWDRSAFIFSIIDHTLFPTIEDGATLPPDYPNNRRTAAELERDVLERGARLRDAQSRDRSSEANGGDATTAAAAGETAAAAPAAPILRGAQLRKRPERLVRLGQHARDAQP